MLASQLPDDALARVASKFKLGTKDAFLKPDMVSVYLFSEDGTVESILDREEAVIDLGSFSGPTEYMANLVNVIIDEQESTRHNSK